MGTDWVELFDLDLAKRIVKLDRAGLGRFLAERGPGLAERDVRLARERNAELAASAAAANAAIERQLAAAGVTVPKEPAEDRAKRERERVEWEARDARRAAARWDELAAQARGDEPLEPLRVEVAWAAGRLTNALYVDYWGCAAEALAHVGLARVCETNLVIEPDDADGAHTYFLLAPHVDLMIVSLRAHWSEVRIMDADDLRKLVEYRDRCGSDPGLRVAYQIDF